MGKNAHHEGNRLLLASKMIEHGFEKGAAFNTPAGVVQVILEDPQEKIEKFYELAKRDYVEWVKQKAKNHQEVKDQIGNPRIHFSNLEFDDDLYVHKLENNGHSLTFDQNYNGLDVYKELLLAIRALTAQINKIGA